MNIIDYCVIKYKLSKLIKNMECRRPYHKGRLLSYKDNLNYIISHKKDDIRDIRVKIESDMEQFEDNTDELSYGVIRGDIDTLSIINNAVKDRYAIMRGLGLGFMLKDKNYGSTKQCI